MTGGRDPLQNDPRSHGLWAHSTEPAPPAEALHGSTQADVVVVGAGFTGLSAALRLAEKGVSVVVLEARDIGYGASGRNVGLVNAGLWLLPREVANRLGDDFGERLIGLLEHGPTRVFELVTRHAMRCEASPIGTLHCAHSVHGLKDLQERTEYWASRGAPVELLDKEQALEKTGSDFFHGALLDHRAGTVQPLAYARGLAKAAAQTGARIHVHSRVRSLSRANGGWRAETDTGSATGDCVIVATNAYTESVGPVFDCIVPCSFYQFATPPLPRQVLDTILPEGHGAWDTAKVLTSFRLNAEGRLIVGSFGKLKRPLRGVHADWTRRKIQHLFPQLDQISFEYGWHGTIAMTRDHLPRMSQPHSGVIFAYGYNGRGIGTGTVFGQVMADYLTSGDVNELPLPLTPMAPEPLRRLRTLGIELGAKTLHWISDRF